MASVHMYYIQELRWKLYGKIRLYWRDLDLQKSTSCRAPSMQAKGAVACYYPSTRRSVGMKMYLTPGIYGKETSRGTSISHRGGVW